MSATRSQTTFASSRRTIGAALGLVLVVAAAPFLRSASAAQPTGDASAVAETAVVAGADATDPAIWVNSQDATKSLILGANNTQLVTYDMTGAVVAQSGVPGASTAGDVTGVDVRNNVTVGTVTGDLAAVVGNKIIRFYAIDRTTGLLTDKTIEPAGINPQTSGWRPRSATKVCMYQSPISNKTYAFIMADNGQIAQLELMDNSGKIDLKMVRGGTTDLTAWDITDGTASGCVVDDAMKTLYVSDTGAGIRKFGAEPTDPTTSTLIDTPAPGHLLPHLKGLAIVKTGDTAGYLVASTLDDAAVTTVNHSFNVYDRSGDNAFIRTFQVMPGLAADRCELTEGIDGAAGNFGSGFASGLFVCQDKKNRTGVSGSGTEDNNYKMVSLDAVADMTPVTTTTTTTAPPVVVTPPTTAPVGSQSTNRSGYWMVGNDGKVYPFGEAKSFGDATLAADALAVDLEPTPSGDGYWIVDNQGHVFAMGDAKGMGDVDKSLMTAGEKVTSLSSTKSGKGYWVFTTLGRVVPFGDAVSLGDMSKTKLNGQVLDSIPSSSGNGYYMVASDGGIFTFGDATFKGSMGDKKLNAPVQSLVPDADGSGYWLVASDGGIFAFDAPFRGSMGSIKLNKPVTGMVRFGNGYLMVAEDGGIFAFSDKKFFGSLGDKPPARPITSVAVLDAPAAAQ